MKNKLKKHSKLFVVGFIVALSVGLYFISPEDIVNYIGVENTYLFMFIVALLGGLSFFGGVPYPLVLITLAAGGANPIILGISAAFGAIIGDSSTYFIGKSTNLILPKKLQGAIEKVLNFFDTYPRYISLFFLIYGAMIPFPNDIITLTAGVKKFNYFKTIIPLGIGNVIFFISLAKFSDYFSRYF